MWGVIDDSKPLHSIVEAARDGGVVECSIRVFWG